MAALIRGSSTITTSVSADVFDAKTDVAHHHKEASDDNDNKSGSGKVTSTSPCEGKSKVATTTPKMSILFNDLADIKVGYVGKIEFVDSQRAHHETFGDNPIIFPANPTNHIKTIS